jgi:hypothetical protein
MRRARQFVEFELGEQILANKHLAGISAEAYTGIVQIIWFQFSPRPRLPLLPTLFVRVQRNLKSIAAFPHLEPECIRTERVCQQIIFRIEHATRVVAR